MLKGGKRYVRARTIFLFYPFETKQSSNDKERKKNIYIYIYTHYFKNNSQMQSVTHLNFRCGAESEKENELTSFLSAPQYDREHIHRFIRIYKLARSCVRAYTSIYECVHERKSCQSSWVTMLFHRNLTHVSFPRTRRRRCIIRWHANYADVKFHLEINFKWI